MRPDQKSYFFLEAIYLMVLAGRSFLVAANKHRTQPFRNVHFLSDQCYGQDAGLVVAIDITPSNKVR
jgi:hypothetical protein